MTDPIQHEIPRGSRLYVAVLDRPSDTFQSRRTHRPEAFAFVGKDRDEVIQRAFRARNVWGRDTYRVLVGVLDSEMRDPVRYEVAPLKPAR